MCFIFLLLSITLFAYSIHLKLKENGKQLHLKMGVFPEMSIVDINNFDELELKEKNLEEIKKDSIMNQ